jgi:L,D-transpeptidase YcbB
MHRRLVGWRTVSVLFMILTVSAGISAQGRTSGTNRRNSNARGRQTLGSLASNLRSLSRAGRLDDLRWPNFSDYRAGVMKFYSRSGYAPAWLRDGQPTPQALQMIDILQQADGEGLRAEDYDSSRWPARLALLQRQHSPSAEARFDVALTVCAMRYASDLHVGRINPRHFSFGLDVGPKKLDLAVFVQQRLADGKDLHSTLAAIEPPFAGYRELRKSLLRYERLAKADDGEKLPMPADIGYPGPPYPGFIRLTRLLRLLGDLPEDYSVAFASSQLFDPSLLQAVRSFQDRHGLPATGYLDAETIKQLNVPLSHRVEQIKLALERYRWLTDNFPQPAIVVNIPGFHLYAFNREGKIVLTMKVDVGEDFDRTRTPVMEDRIEYLVFRPYWNVPLDIQRNEIPPIVAEHPNYLSKFHFQVISPAGNLTIRGPATKKMLQEIQAGTIRLRQGPGSDNPMGLVKFVFPNRYDIYLHDTPAGDLRFVFWQRVVSHGCIHLEKPAELAAWVLRDKPQWTLERVQQAMHHGPDNVRVSLSKPLPVLIVYTTVSTWEPGHVHFYRDIYGYDADLLQALAKGYPYPTGN